MPDSRYPYPIRRKNKKCDWCGERFTPKPNNINRQKYCSYPSRMCRILAKKAQEKEWRDAHPEYFKDRKARIAATRELEHEQAKVKEAAAEAETPIEGVDG